MSEWTTARARRAAGGVLACIAAFGLSAVVAGQVPPGYVAMAAARTPSNQLYSGMGGIYALHPRTPGSLTALTGVPSALTGVANPPGSTYSLGANAIAVDPVSGDVYAAETGPFGTPIHLWRLNLNGRNVVGFSQWQLGTASSTAGNGAVAQLALLPGGRALAACYRIRGVNGVGYAGCLCIVDTISGTVTFVPTSRALGMINAVCADPTGTTAYIFEWNTRQVCSVALTGPGFGTVTFLVTLPNQGCSQLALEADGDRLIAACGTPPEIHEIQISTGAILFPPILTGWANLNSLTIEPATGNLLFNARNLVTGAYGIFWMPPTPGATPTLLGNSGQGGTAVGVPMGLAAVPDPTRYGTPSAWPASGPTFTWSSAPNPNGLPLVGCPFQVAVDVPSGVTISGEWCFVSARGLLLRPITVPGLGLDLWLDPTVMCGAFSPLSPHPYPPNTGVLRIVLPPGLPIGGKAFLQAIVTTQAGAIAATDGLELTFL